MDLLNRALEQVIDQLVTQKVALLKLEIENQKKTIFGKVFQSFKFWEVLDLSLRIEKKELEHERRLDDVERQNQLLTAKILLMENEKIMNQNDQKVNHQKFDRN